MPQLYLPCRHVSDVHKIPSSGNRNALENTQVHVSPRPARFSLYRILLLFTASMWGEIDGVALYQPRSRARPRGAAPFIVLQKRQLQC